MKRLALQSEGRAAASSDNHFEGSKPPQAKKRRFAVSVAEEVDSCKKPLEVKSTQKSTMHVGSAFYSWLEERNDRSEEKFLCLEDKALLRHLLCIFVKEARCENGEEYTPRIASFPGSCAEEEEREPGTHCSRMHQVFLGNLYTTLLH